MQFDLDNTKIVSVVPICCRWCGPCKILGPRLEKAIAKQKGRVAMAKVDIDDHTDLAIEYGVRYSHKSHLFVCVMFNSSQTELFLNSCFCRCLLFQR